LQSSIWNGQFSEITPWDDEISMNYHLAQWINQKESTKTFRIFLDRKLRASKRVLDIGTGGGAALSYLASRFPEVEFTGLEPNHSLVTLANEESSKKGLTNLTFSPGNFATLESQNDHFDGVISLNTLSYIEECFQPLNNIISHLKPSWIGIHSLFYDGGISARIEIFEHKRQRKTFYNTYSLDEIDNFCISLGYKLTSVQPFQMPFPLSKPENKDVMGTYTQTVVGEDDHLHLQFSGPILMSHYFLIIEPLN
jgi:ubiquinone/menaquinone biosynthesis C-methylase UbiE